MKPEKNTVFALALIAVIVLLVFIRLQNTALVAGPQFADPDSYLFVRYALEIDETGFLSQKDELQSITFEQGPSIRSYSLASQIAVFHQFYSFIFPSTSLEDSSKLFPIFSAIILLIAFFCFCCIISGKKTALLASTILAVFPGEFLFRSLYGAVSKEAPVMAAILFCFALFLLALKRKDWLKLSIPGGILLVLIALSWSAITFVAACFSLFLVFLFLSGKLESRAMKCFAVFWLPLVLLNALVFQDYFNISNLLVAGAFLFIILSKAVHKFFVSKRFDLTQAQTGFILMLLFSSVLFLVNSPLFSFFTGFLSNPTGATQIMQGIVSELRPLTFERLSFNTALLWLPAVLGLGVFLQQFFKKTKLKSLVIAFLGMIFFALVFSSNHFFFLKQHYSLIIFLSMFLSAFAASLIEWNKPEKTTQFLFVLSCSVIAVLLAAGVLRGIFFLAPFIAFFAAKAIMFFFEKAFSKEFKIIHYIVFSVLIFCLVFSAFTAFDKARAQGSTSGVQWVSAVRWLSENASSQPTVIAFWDRGYLLQYFGMKTIADGRLFLYDYGIAINGIILDNGSKTQKTIDFLGASHLVADSRSFEGFNFFYQGEEELSNPSYFIQRKKAVQGDNSTVIGFFGQQALEEDFDFNGVLFPAKESKITQIQLYSKGERLIAQAMVEFNDTNRIVPLKCVVEDGIRKDFDVNSIKTLDACIVLAGGYNPVFVPRIFAIFLSEKAMQSNILKLYLLDEETSFFEKIYDDTQYRKLGYFNGKFLGPIKIWKIVSQEQPDKEPVEHP